MLETVRDTDSTSALPNLAQALLDLLRSGEPSFHKDSSEYQFRRVLFETLSRLPLNDALRSKIPSIWAGMLHLLRHENEENGISASKILLDIVRGHRSLTEENLAEFVAIFQKAFAGMQGLVNQYLSEDSLPLDANVSLPALQSFKVLAEMTMVMVLI
jgi:transformation/transcription domain-associated protein